MVVPVLRALGSLAAGLLAEADCARRALRCVRSKEKPGRDEVDVGASVNSDMVVVAMGGVDLGSCFCCCCCCCCCCCYRQRGGEPFRRMLFWRRASRAIERCMMEKKSANEEDQ